MMMRIAAAVVLLCCTVPAWADQGDRMGQLDEKITRAVAGKPGEYARDMLDAARSSLDAARAALKAGLARVSDQNLELAEQQLAAAEVKASEKEVIELVAVRRAELRKLEAQLERYRQGEDK